MTSRAPVPPERRGHDARVGPRVPVLLGAGVLGLALLLAVFVAITGDHVDFDVYVRAGERWLCGLDPYAVRAELPFTYPPVAVPFSALLALAPAVGLAVLSLLTVLAAGGGTAATLVPSTRTAGPRTTTGIVLLAVGVAVVSEPVLRGLSLGQANGLVVGLVLLDLLVVPLRWRGWLTGIAAGTKLTPLVFVLVPAFRRQWSTVARVVGGFAATVVLGALALPSGSGLYWGGLVADTDRVGGLAFVDNQSLRGVAERLAPEHATAWWLLASTLVGVLGAVALHRRARQPVIEGLVVAGLVGLLASPISWSHHWLLLPAAALLCARERRRWVAGGTLLVCLAAPHWYLRAADLPAPLSVLVDNSMILAGVLCLAALALSPRPRAEDGVSDSAGPR
ncbi:MAG: glycosyltransferase 87 family protein [Terracoccus sp.]